MPEPPPGPAPERPTDLSLREVQQLIDSWMRQRGWGYWEPLSQLARMTEELGELARIVNHLYGEKPKKTGEAEQELGLEMADLLYTMICLANSQGIDLQDALERTLEKYGTRDAERYTPSAPGAPRTLGGPGGGS